MYSRKQFWLYLGAALSLVVAWVIYEVFARPPLSILPYIAGMVTLFACALYFGAFIHLDEIQQAEKLKVWACGAVGGAILSALAVKLTVVQPAILEAATTALSPRKPHIARDYFVIGVVLVLASQFLASVVIDAGIRIKRKA